MPERPGDIWSNRSCPAGILLHVVYNQVLMALLSWDVSVDADYVARLDET